MDEFLEFLRLHGGDLPAGAGSPVAPVQPNPLLEPKTVPRRLQAITGGYHARESRIPGLSGSTGQVADLPGMRRRIMLDPSAVGQDAILAHEAGHVLDFADEEGSALREQLGLDKEEFAELFEAAVLDPRIRGPVSDQKQQMIDFIDQRIREFTQRRTQRLTAAQDATLIGRR